jgi:hypothetical protein
MALCGSRELCLAGKLEGRSAVMATATATKDGRVYCVKDELSGKFFLVDTGEAYSVIPHTSAEKPVGPALKGADGSRISCWGPSTRTVNLADSSFTWKFLLAAVSFPIIGADFIKHHQLVVDLANEYLLSPLLNLKIKLCFSPDTGFFSVVLLVGLADPEGEGGGIEDLAKEFSKVFDSHSPSLPRCRHGVYHRIEMTGRPVAAKYRRLDAEKLRAAKAEFAELEKQGIIRRSSSCWSSPLHMVRKEGGTWRPCGDYRKLNLQTTPLHVPQHG